MNARRAQVGRRGGLVAVQGLRDHAAAGNLRGPVAELHARGRYAACLILAAVSNLASGQSSALLEVHFEPPLYTASSEGVRLAGQDGWSPSRGGDWLVFTFDDNPLHIPAKPFAPRDTQFAAARAPAVEAAEIDRTVDLGTHGWRLTVEVAVTFEGPPPPAGKVGSLSLEPIAESAGIALVPQWEDRSGLWRASMLVFDASGRPGLVDLGRGFDGLKPHAWYRWNVLTDGRRVIDVWLRDLATGRVQTMKPVEWYRGLGEPPDIVRMSAEPTASSESGIAFDDLLIYTRSCGDLIDCDRSGQLDFFDFLCFQEAFVTGAPYADFDGDGELTFFDFLGFQLLFCCGCP